MGRNLNEDVFSLVADKFLPQDSRLHIYRKKVICLTDSKGHENPEAKSMAELIVDSSKGFIPLWDRGVTLNWRFSKDFATYFNDGSRAKLEFKKLLGESISAWKDACPIKFSENNDAWDFEISIAADICNQNGCVLASAFFPDTGQNKLVIYPKLFQQNRPEQLETLQHELGHIFGLRHFFAQIQETRWRSEIFGNQNPFTIMNYGNESRLTDDDVADLKKLYEMVWSGQLREINSTKIKLFRSFQSAPANSPNTAYGI